jgi:hypothetical protein
MLVALQGMLALRQLRMELQEDAGDAFPSSVHTEMLVLYDVCKSLDLNIFQCREILGEACWAYINDYLTSAVSLPLQQTNGD